MFDSGREGRERHQSQPPVKRTGFRLVKKGEVAVDQRDGHHAGQQPADQANCQGRGHSLRHGGLPGHHKLLRALLGARREE